jgi:dihydroorotate dehydrogenase
MYKSLVRPLFFAMQPETAHDVMRTLSRCANLSPISTMLRRCNVVNDPRLAVTVAGLSFPNPIGLAAGLDKNAELLGLWSGLGFGHIELGTVTAQAQPGNPKPRIFRYAGDVALINRMGFPSEGADEVAIRLAEMRGRLKTLPPIGINIGKSKVTDIDRAIDDYLYSFKTLSPLADYVTVNVSSPNTPGLRQLQERERLSALLGALQEVNKDRKPLFVKVAPDLSFSAIEELIECCEVTGIAGLIATNTTISRDGLSVATDEAGGLSGGPLRQKALEVVTFIGSRLKGPMALIGVGGISNYTHVLDMLAAGASAVQLYTALIYEGPAVARAILRGLTRFMDDNNCASLTEATNVWKNRL